MKKNHTVFVEGPIAPDFIAQSIEKHQSKTDIGAHAIFLGQVRADEKNGKTVERIEYTAYHEMAVQIFQDIREAAFEQFSLSCMHIYHSLGAVKTGEICFFVFVSSPHRKASFEAIEYLVEEIKAKAPIFGKEIFEEGVYQWKQNQ